MVLTRTLMKVAPIAIGGLLMILYFKGAFTKGASFAGADIGSSFQSLGSGIGTGFGSLGTGISTFGQGLGTGISGLFKPIWELINIGKAITVSEPRVASPKSSSSSSSSQRVSSQPRTNTGGWSVATHATSGGRTR